MTALPHGFDRSLRVTNAPAEETGARVSRHQLTDWIVPPVIVPLFLLLLIVAVAAWRG
jgi:hypothetical protein